MKKLAEIDALLAKFEKQYGISAIGAEQGSEAWLRIKLGVLSASKIGDALAKPGSETRLTYLCDLVGQVCTSEIEEIDAKALSWGKQNEAGVRAGYEFETGLTVQPVTFVFKDDKFREGCSPDGLVTDLKGVEIKCPYRTANYIKFLCADKIKPEWYKQVQFCIRVLDAGEWDFGQADPRMFAQPMKYVTIPRDEEVQKRFDDEIPAFLEDMDKMLASLGVKYGDQWKRIAETNKIIEGNSVSA